MGDHIIICNCGFKGNNYEYNAHLKERKRKGDRVGIFGHQRNRAEEELRDKSLSSKISLEELRNILILLSELDTFVYRRDFPETVDRIAKARKFINETMNIIE